jgi:hypothetical protein
VAVVSIDGVHRGVRSAFELLPLQGVAGALDDLDTASATMQETVAGSNDSDAAAVVGDFQLAASLARDVQHLLHVVQSKMQAYLDRLGGGDSSGSTGQAGGAGTSRTPTEQQGRGGQPRQGKGLTH